MMWAYDWARPKMGWALGYVLWSDTAHIPKTMNEERIQYTFTHTWHSRGSVSDKTLQVVDFLGTSKIIKTASPKLSE